MAATKKAAKKVTGSKATPKTPAKKPAAKASAPPKALKAGDRVEWNSSGGKSVGKVVKKATGTTRVKSHVAKATPANPEYVVQSDKSGKQAVHKPAELKKAK